MPLTRQLVILLLLCFPAAVKAFQLVPYEQNGRLGLIDTANVDTVLTAQFEAFGWSNKPFEPNAEIFGARLNEKWALVTKEGKKLTQHLYTDLFPWQNGQLIASTRATNSVWLNYGTLNERGKVEVAFEYLTLKPNGSQLIVSQKTEDRFIKGVLDAGGKPIIPIAYEDVKALGDNRYAVQETDGLSALFTDRGERLSGFEFEEISLHSENLLAVTYYNRKGMINKNGEVIIIPIYKEIEVDNDKARVMGFRNWDYFKMGETQKAYNFDKINQISENTFAITTGQNIAIIDKEESYLGYLTAHSIMDSNERAIVIQSNKTQYYGLLNTKGETVLPTNFDSLKLYENFVLAKIHRNDGQHWFAYNFDGQKINSSGYESFKTFSKSKFIAVRNGKYGLTDRYGAELTTFQYDSISTFNRGLSIVKSRDFYGVIDEKGIWVITPYKDSIQFYGDEIYFKQGSEYGIADRSGNTIYRGYDKIWPLPKGFYKAENDGYKIFDLKGNELLERAYDSVRMINSVLWLLERDSLYFIFRPEDQADFKLPEGVQKVTSYSEHHIKILKDDQWGFVSEMGHLTIANRYDSIGDFSEGLCPVQLIGKWGVVNRSEEIVVQPVYTHIAPYFNGMTVVTKPNGDKGLIDRNGDFVLSAIYTELIRTEAGIILGVGNAYGLANTDGTLIRAPQYDSIEQLENGFFLVSKSGKFGVISLKGEDVVPVAYETIQQFNNSFLGSKASDWETIKLDQ